ncbi:hypothetical protein PUN28_008571 [Cardiocondyla obscurior]|uniref:Uncharacterized protein n=1 Tax=Cardiocondyla obscurior TaxID=286306 RepID=A0AAW2G496_9HYME
MPLEQSLMISLLFAHQFKPHRPFYPRATDDSKNVREVPENATLLRI